MTAMIFPLMFLPAAASGRGELYRLAGRWVFGMFEAPDALDGELEFVLMMEVCLHPLQGRIELVTYTS